MKTYPIIILFILFCSENLLSQILFQRNYGDDLAAEYGQSVIQASDSGYFVTGVRVRDIGNGFIGEALLLLTNKYGDEVWMKFYSAQGSDDLTFDYLIHTSDQNLVAAGVVSYGSPDEYDAYLIKLDTNGNVLWQKNYGGLYRQRGNQVKETMDKGFIIGGWNELSGTAISSFYLIKTSSNGDTIWTRAYPNGMQQYGHTVVQTPDSGFVIAGSIDLPSQIGTDIYVIKTNPSGDTLWTKIIDVPGSGEARDIKIADNGNIIISGWVAPQGCADAFLTELDQSGSIIWFETYDSGFCEWSYSVCKTNDNGYALFGMDHASDFQLIKTDSQGNLQWTKKFDEGPIDYGYSVNQTFDGGFIMTGITKSNQTNIALIKTDSTGNITSGINGEEPVQNIRVYPNPTRSAIKVLIPENNDSQYLQIFNLSGQIMYSANIEHRNSIELDLSDYPEGMYIINIGYYNTKILKQQ